MSNDTSLLAGTWVETSHGRRPMLPSEQRTVGTATQRRLPSPRLIPGAERTLTPWSNRNANDWRSQWPSASEDK